MNILIIKTGALGDVLRCTFIAQALKEKYKKQNPKIFWLTSKEAKPFFLNNPYVDELFFNHDADLKKISKIKFDLIVSLEESSKLAKLTSNLKPKKIQGFYLKNGKVVSSKSAEEWFNMSAIGPKPENDILKKKNKKNHNELMSDIVGIPKERYLPFLRLTKKQKNIAKSFMEKHNLLRTDFIVGINTGAADRWPKSLSIKKTVELIEKIYKKFNAKILLFGGPNEIERNKEIIQLANAPIIDTGCGNNLYEFPALISSCSLFITSDSLGLHIALALKRKVICLVGPTSASELGMYGLGKKVISKSNCTCCYKADCKSMEKINVKEIIKSVSNLTKQKITFLITAFKEPKTISACIESVLNQKTSKEYEILISAPDDETLNAAKKYKDKNIKIFRDPGRGKSYALNLIFSKLKTDILILTDGDVYVGENSVESISNLFLDPEIGCVSGRPVPQENKKTKYGYWANFLFDSAHRLRKAAFLDNKFLECSGYLFAFRKSFIKKIPLDVAEDTVIPYLFWQRGYSIGYAEDAKVYVKNVDNLKDWIDQKIRTSKAHETLERYVDTKTTPRVKSFKTESKGINWLLTYPDSFKEFFWSLQLAFSRFYMWAVVLFHTKFAKKNYTDAWERIESTK
ncbi:MAG: glycosyltransferase [Candidatus Pacearchaeota archaeon]|jgi:heptosyltransferase-2